MEDRRFDDLTKALAAPTTRRQALKRLGVGLAGALAGAFGLGRAEEVAADHCKTLGFKCEFNEECCSKNCDKNGRQCACNPLTQIACQNPTDPHAQCVDRCTNINDPCKVSLCNPNTGQCVPENAADGTLCDDGDLCTVGDQCQNGTCQPGKLTVCDACYKCNPKTGICEVDLEQVGKTCPDKDKCTQNSTCQATGACVGEAVVCDDKNPCTTDTCDPKTGCVYTNVDNNTPCDLDANLCTLDTCQGGVCKAGSQKVCDPTNNPCTVNVCNQKTGVCEIQNVKDGTGCNDGLACTTGETCQSGVCTGTSTCTGDKSFCCGLGTTRVGQCQRAPGATCSNNNQCCNTCSSGKCT